MRSRTSTRRTSSARALEIVDLSSSNRSASMNRPAARSWRADVEVSIVEVFLREPVLRRHAVADLIICAHEALNRQTKRSHLPTFKSERLGISVRYFTAR